MKFENYHEEYDSIKALTFISQFEIAFHEEEFSKRSKLKHVGMYMKETVAHWWLAEKLCDNTITTWNEFFTYSLLQSYSLSLYKLP